MKLQKKTIGILLILLSSLSFSLMSVFVVLAGDIPFFQKALFRNGVALLVATVTLVASRQPLHVPQPCRIPVLSRILCGVISVFCNFYAIDRLILANSNSLNKLAPFFAIFLAAIFLKEKVERMQVVCMSIAFAGSLFIIVPSMSIAAVSIPSLVAFLGGFTTGGTQASLRAIQRAGYVHSSVVVFYFSLSTTVVALVPAIFLWTPMTAQQVFFLMLAGTACAFGQYALTNAYRYAAPKDISIYDCSQIIFSGILGYLVFRQIPTVYSVIAYILIIAASALLLLYQHSPHEPAHSSAPGTPSH